MPNTAVDFHQSFKYFLLLTPSGKQLKKMWKSQMQVTVPYWDEYKKKPKKKRQNNTTLNLREKS